MNDNNRPPLPRLFHVYMGILVILGAFAMGVSAKSERANLNCYAGCDVISSTW